MTPPAMSKASVAAPQRSLDRLLEGLGVVALIAVVVLRSLSVDDLLLWDEADYLARGRAIAQGVWPAFSNGAIYSDLYALVVRITPDPVTTFQIVRALDAVLLVVALWAATRLVAGPMLAWSVAAAIALTSSPYVVPGVSLPATACLVVATALLIHRRTPLSIGVAAALVWLAAAARPEYVWVALIASLVAVGTLTTALLGRASRHPSLGQSALTALSAVGVPMVLGLVHGSPFTSDSSGWPFLGQAIPRDWLAFAQNFSVRYAQPAEDPWLDWQAIMARSFPGAESVADAVRQQPTLVASHMLDNAALSPTVATHDLLGTLGVVGLVIMGTGFVIALMAAGRAALTRAARLARSAVAAKNVASAALILALYVAALMPVVILFPRPHYLVPVLALLLLAVAALQSRLGSARFARFVPLAVMAVATAVLAAGTIRLAADRANEPPLLASSVRVMNSTGQAWTVLSLDTGLTSYLNDAVQVSNTPPAAGESFESFIKRTGVNAVLLNARFSRGAWAKAPGAADFEDDPTTIGFAPAVPNSPIWIRVNG